MTEIVTNEDTVECRYFSTNVLSESDWNLFCCKINEEIDTLSKNFLWHKDKLDVVFPILNSSEDHLPKFLTSTTCFSDNVEDEWFITYLLFELTKKFDNLVVQVHDNDGYFLLIEAADFLPKWVRPDNTDNRVFVYHNKIHLISPAIFELEKKITMLEAMDLLLSHSEDTEASSDIQMAVYRKICDYPQKIDEGKHKCIVKLPSEIASVLTLKPSLISPIVHAFCNHDIIDLKSCKNVDFVEYIDVNVTFTKCLYAMILHAKNIKLKPPKELDMKKKNCELGLKLVYGYKIIMDNSDSNIFLSKSYNKFVKSLDDKGYFQGNMEGSKDHKLLLEKANNFYLSTISPINSNARDIITSVLNNDEFHKCCQELRKSDVTLEEDSDDWLTIHPDQLNNLLNERYGKHVKFNSDLTAESLSKDLKTFLYKSSDYEGIETDRDGESNDQTIDFDPNEFADSLKKMLNIITNGNEDLSDSDSFDEDEDSELGEESRVEDLLDKEIKESLQHNKLVNNCDSKSIINNIAQSLRDEKAYLGPSSNLLHNIGISKKDILDSDDDSEGE